MSTLSYSSMSDAAPEPQPTAPAAPAILDYSASNKAPPPAVPGQLSYRPWGNEPERPFVDPGNDPVAVKHEFLRLLGYDEGRALLKETIDSDPAAASVWLEKLGLTDNAQLRNMVVLSKMYANSRRRR